MKVRQLINNDYNLGVFLKDTPETVAQAILTRLKLWTSEYFVDLTEGTPYLEEIVGHTAEHTKSYDLAIQERILGTTGVQEITEYSSVLDETRKLSVNCTVLTDYGITNITGTI